MQNGKQTRDLIPQISFVPYGCHYRETLQLQCLSPMGAWSMRTHAMFTPQNRHVYSIAGVCSWTFSA